MSGARRVPDAHFEARYRVDADPWRLEGRWYERRKRALTMASLTQPRYRRALEPGCALGLLTELLAARCEEVVAVDAAPTAVAAATRRCAAQPHVRVDVMAVPDAWPAGRFDLIVLSEIGYYLPRSGIEVLRDTALEHLDDDGELLAVHYRPDADEHVTNGDVVHEVLRTASGLVRVAEHAEELFLIDVFRRAPGLTPRRRRGAQGRRAGR